MASLTVRSSCEISGCKVTSNSSFSMEDLTVLTAVLRVLEMPLLFNFSNTHLHFHMLPQTMNYAALCHKPEAFSGLAFWLFHSAWGFIKNLISLFFCQKGIHIYSYLNYNSLMKRWTQGQTGRRDRGKNLQVRLEDSKWVVIQLGDEVTETMLLAHYISY